MVVSLEYELVTFFASVILALSIGVLYDFFHAVRIHGKKSLLWDVVMWIAILFLIVTVWFYVQNGEVRWYAVLGAFLTGVIYFFSLSKYVFFVMNFLVGKICVFFCIFFKILLTPPRFLCKIIGVYMVKAKSKFSKKVEEKYDDKKA